MDRGSDRAGGLTEGTAGPAGGHAQGVAEVAQQRPSVSNLRCVRRSLADAIGVDTGPIARNHLDTGMLAQLIGQAFGVAIGQKINHPVTFEIADNRAVSQAAPPGPFIHTNHPRRRRGIDPGGADHAQQRIATDRHGLPMRRRDPGSPPRARPMFCWVRARRSVRRAFGMTTSGRRSVKMLRSQSATKQRNRRTGTRISTARSGQGTSARRR